MRTHLYRNAYVLLAPLFIAGLASAQEGPASPARASTDGGAVTDESRADSEALAKCQALPGFDELRERFSLDRASQGYINRLDSESLFAVLTASVPATLTSAWWLNPVENGKVLFDWHVFLALFSHVDELLSRHKWLAEWKAAGPGRLLELHAFGQSPASEPDDIAANVLPIWRGARFAGEPQYEVLARLDNHAWLSLFLNDTDPRVLVSYSIGLSSQPLHWLDGMNVAFHPMCTRGTASARYATIAPTGEHQTHEYRQCAP